MGTMVSPFRMKLPSFVIVLMNIVVLGISMSKAYGAIRNDIGKKIERINQGGPYLGIVVPNSYEMNPLLNSSSFVVDGEFPFLDFSGRRFRFGKLGNQSVIVAMTGLGMLNAGITTQLLLSLFEVKGIVHYGIAGNANPDLQIGDVTIPQYWAHTGLWNWQRNGDGPNDELALEPSGDYTRNIGYLKFSDYNNATENGKPIENFLNNVWYQPEEIFPIYGTPEVRQHAFWVPVDNYYFRVAKKLEGLKLGSCVNTTCLPRTTMVVRVKNGVSANVFVDNGAYRTFLSTKFNVSTIDMESAAIALVCIQQKTPFIAIRALSDLAGGGSDLSNEADIFSLLAAQNAVHAVVEFVTLLLS